jgi:uncharacterized protein YndB with AHSA1/START domain
VGPIFASIAVDAPRERTFELLSDLALRPSICDFQEHFRLERLESKGVGAAARYRVEAPFNHAWAETRIEQAEEPHLLREHGRQGRWNRIPTHTVWEILEGPGAGSTVKVAFWTEPSNLLDRLREKLGSARWYRRRLRRALERLRDAAEAPEAGLVRAAVAAG